MPSPSLPAVLQETGYKSCSSAETIGKILAKFPDGSFTPEAVARTLGMMAGPAALAPDDSTALQLTPGTDVAAWDKKDKGAEAMSTPSSWNVKVFVEAVRTRAPKLDWKAVLRALDYPQFAVKTIEGLGLLVEAYRHATSESAAFPGDVFFADWANSAAQLSVLRVLTRPELLKHPVVTTILASCTRRESREGLKVGLEFFQPLLSPAPPPLSSQQRF